MKFYNTNNKSDYQLGILKLYSYALKMAGVLLWSPMVVPIIGEDEVTSIWLVALPAWSRHLALIRMACGVYDSRNFEQV